MLNENNSNNKVDIHERIACLEVKVDAIIQNHIPHLEGSIRNTNNKLGNLDIKFGELKIWQTKVMTIFAVIVFLITIFGDKISRLIFK